MFTDYYSSAYSSEIRGDIMFADGTIIKGDSDFITYLKQIPYLEGTADPDMLTSEANTRTMEGKEGDDFIVINPDSDNVTIKYNKGDGRDIIHTLGNAGNHRLLFGEDIIPSDLKFSQPWSSALSISINETDLYIEEFYRAGTQISTIEFHNGAIITTADILELGLDALTLACQI